MQERGGFGEVGLLRVRVHGEGRETTSDEQRGILRFAQDDGFLFIVRLEARRLGRGPSSRKTLLRMTVALFVGQEGFRAFGEWRSRGSVALDDEDGFVVDAVEFAVAAQVIVAFQSIIEQSVANVFC